MSEVSDLEKMRRTVQSFCEARDWDQFHGPKDLAIGLVTESSELLEIFRFVSDKKSKELFVDPIKKESIKDELADVLFFLLRFAQMNNIDLKKAFYKKIEKNEKRYSIEKSKGSNKKL